MPFFLSLVNGLFDLLFWPFRTLDPRYGLVVFSLLASAFLVFVFRYASNQQAIRRVKDRLQAHVLAVRLYQDQLGVVLRSYGRILRCTLTYLRHCLKPLAVMLVPMVLLLAQVELRLGRVALQPMDTFLLQARLDGRVPADQVTLRLPDGLALSAPPVRIPEQKEISWRIRAETYGDFPIEVMAAGQSFTKQVTVAPDLARLSAARLQSNWLQALLHPGELPLPADGPLETIQVRYPPRSIELGPYRGHWLIPFFVLVTVWTLAAKAVTRTQF